MIYQNFFTNQKLILSIKETTLDKKNRYQLGFLPRKFVKRAKKVENKSHKDTKEIV